VDEGARQPLFVAVGRPSAIRDEESVYLRRHQGVDDVGGVPFSQMGS
jgi:hypothetical protein